MRQGMTILEISYGGKIVFIRYGLTTTIIHNIFAPAAIITGHFPLLSPNILQYSASKESLLKVMDGRYRIVKI